MARAKKKIGIDVVTAARQRIEHIYDAFDTVVVMYSGGKDSSVVLQLIREYQEANGLGPVKAVFRDEEIINPSVKEHVARIRDEPWVDLHWFALPFVTSKWVLGTKERVVLWDPEREWVTTMPEWAITGDDVGLTPGETVNEHTSDDLIANYMNLKGKIAFVTGVRAAESLIRFRSVTQKLNENYIGAIEGNVKSPVKLCKPIYDWSQDDVLKFLHESEGELCEVYDWQNLTHTPLRVSSALHPVATKQFFRLAATEPEYYQRIVDIFPEMRDQERYWGEFDKEGLLADYADEGWMGVLRYIRENIKSPAGRASAMKSYRLWKGRHETDPENYPIEQLLKEIAFGFTSRRLAGKYVNSKAELKATAAREKRNERSD